MKFLIIISLLLIAPFTKGQGNVVNDTTLIVCYVPHMPQFPGGQQAMDSFVRANFVIPDSIVPLCLSGKIYLEFVVDTFGKMQDIKVIQNRISIDSANLSNEAVRVLNLLNQYYTWVPAEQSNSKQPVRYRYPIILERNIKTESEE